MRHEGIAAGRAWVGPTPSRPTRRTPKTIDESPMIDNTRRSTSNRPAGLGWRVVDPAQGEEDDPDDHHLGHEDPTPRGDVVTAPPISGLAATAMALAAAIIP